MKSLPVIGRAPVLILWNYGHWCNMDCLHCYSRVSARQTDRDMSRVEAASIAEKFIKAGVMHVHFGGGEPLGREDLLPIASRLKSSGIRVTLSTNGWFLDEAMAESLSSLPFSVVAFSIHGSDAASHDGFTRRDGAWSRMTAAINRMVQRDIPTKLVMTLMRPTARHATKLLELAVKWGVKAVQFQTFKEYGNAQEHATELALTRDEWRNLYAELQQASTVAASRGLTVDLGLDSDPVLAAEIGLPSSHGECICGIYSLTVRPNGDIVACPFSSEAVGNLHRDSLLSLWQSHPELAKIRSGAKRPCGRT